MAGIKSLRPLYEKFIDTANPRHGRIYLRPGHSTRRYKVEEHESESARVRVPELSRGLLASTAKRSFW